jgi:allophanate hydrolase subunit 2
MDLIGQLQPHTPARFVEVTMAEALTARHDQAKLYNQIIEAL